MFSYSIETARPFLVAIKAALEPGEEFHHASVAKAELHRPIAEFAVIWVIGIPVSDYLFSFHYSTPTLFCPQSGNAVSKNPRTARVVVGTGEVTHISSVYVLNRVRRRGDRGVVSPRLVRSFLK